MPLRLVEQLLDLLIVHLGTGAQVGSGVDEEVVRAKLDQVILAILQMDRGYKSRLIIDSSNFRAGGCVCVWVMVARARFAFLTSGSSQLSSRPFSFGAMFRFRPINSSRRAAAANTAIVDKRYCASQAGNVTKIKNKKIVFVI